MKKLLFALLIIFTACKKNTCAVCSRVVVGPDMRGGILHDTLYNDSKFCGDQLNDEKKHNGEYSEVQQGGNTYRYTTQVRCH